MNQEIKHDNEQEITYENTCFVGITRLSDQSEMYLLKKEAEQGSAKAQKDLADRYFAGRGVEQDSATAFEWLKKAAEQGYFPAYFPLAECYFDGIGVKQDYTQAVKWFKQCADHVFPSRAYFDQHQHEEEQKKAQCKLADCYFYGYGVEQSPVKAIEWLGKAATRGFAPAQFRLADCYFDGVGVEKDSQRGIEWLEKAAGHGDRQEFTRNGSRLAQRKLGFHFLKEENYTEAVKWFREAVYSHSLEYGLGGIRKEAARAKTELGICYYYAKDYDSASEIFKLPCSIPMRDDCFWQLWMAYFTYRENKPMAEKISDFERLRYSGYMTVTGVEMLSPSEIEIENERYENVRNVTENEKRIVEYLDKAAVGLFFSDEEINSEYLDIVRFAFHDDVICFLEQDENSPAKVILAFYYRYQKKHEKYMECLIQASKQDILANYLLGKYYKDSEYFDKATHYFNQVDKVGGVEYSPRDVKKFTLSKYPLNAQQFLAYSAKEELNSIKHQEDMAKKNRELNNLVAMFAHNFLGTLQCIRSNAEHENNPNIHLKTVKMMGGALTAFSILSVDDDKLVEQLKQDNVGETSLQQSLANNLALAISQLLGKTNKDKIVNLYLHHLRENQQIESDITSEELRSNRDYRKKWQALQHQWEDEFNALFSEKADLPVLQKWISDNFFSVEIIGFDSYNISFKEFGITDSIFLIVFMEIFVNALKYMDVSKNEPLILRLCEEDRCYKLVCENPSSQETGRGTHKGMDFLKTIAKKLGGQFVAEVSGNSFKSIFAIPSELLK